MTAKEQRNRQRQQRLKHWHEFIESLPPEEEPEQTQPVEPVAIVTYSHNELFDLWCDRLRFCGKDAVSMLADFACVSADDAAALIAEFERESGLTSCSVQPETPPVSFVASMPVDDTTEPKKPVKRKRTFKAHDVVEPPPVEQSRLQIVIAENLKYSGNRVVVLSLPLCGLYSVLTTKSGQLTAIYFSNADAALTYARKHRKLQYYQDISAAALSDYKL